MAVDNWWYSRVLASPNPETEEQVNVALLIGNGRPESLEFVGDLPRLEGMTSREQRAYIREILAGVREGLVRGAEIALIKQMAGPQVRFSEKIPLHERPSKRVVEVLRRRFLLSPPDGDEHQASTPPDRLFEALQSNLARMVHPTGLELLPRPKPKRLYPSISDRLRGVPTIDVAVRSFNSDLLLGYVDVREGSPSQVLRNPGIRLHKAFWSYRQARELIREVEQRELWTVGVLFRPSDPRGAARDAFDYLEHIWNRDTDSVVTIDDESQIENRIASFVEELAGR